MQEQQLIALTLIDRNRSVQGLTDRAVALIGRHQGTLRDLGLIKHAPDRSIAWKITAAGKKALQTGDRKAD
jgi:hypothetical protein